MVMCDICDRELDEVVQGEFVRECAHCFRPLVAWYSVPATLCPACEERWERDCHLDACARDSPPEDA